jgi:hypothetical protein
MIVAERVVRTVYVMLNVAMVSEKVLKNVILAQIMELFVVHLQVKLVIIATADLVL